MHEFYESCTLNKVQLDKSLRSSPDVIHLLLGFVLRSLQGCLCTCRRHASGLVWTGRCQVPGNPEQERRAAEILASMPEDQRKNAARLGFVAIGLRKRGPSFESISEEI